MDTFKVAIIGAGGISESHIRACNANKNVEITAIAEIKTERAEKLCQEYGLHAKIYTDYKKMLDENTVDFSIINLPHYLHKEAALYCAQKGCNILLEKPMALSTCECDEIISAAAAANVKLMIGHVIHYYPETMLARELVASGKLGRLLMVNDLRSAAYFTPDRPLWFLNKKLSGGGILINLGAHSIDRTMWITGRKIKEVQASVCQTHPDYGVEGHAQLKLLLDNDVPVTITVYGYEDFEKNRIELFFTGGVAEVIYGEGVWVNRGGSRTKLEGDFKDAFELQLDDFLKVLKNEGSNPIPGEYGKEVIKVIQKSYELNRL